MKLNKFALALTVAALLPTFAHAGVDSVAASFERDLQGGAAVESVVLAGAGGVDPLVSAINTALNGTSDPILASFERDLYRAPSVTATVLLAGETDPLTRAVNVALQSNPPVMQATVTAGYRRGC
ncbi:MAG: hypothetical protein Q7S94_08075 [Gallionella sp.]|nr:hypothetical protein [Gallionella sp.]